MACLMEWGSNWGYTEWRPQAPVVEARGSSSAVCYMTTGREVSDLTTLPIQSTSSGSQLRGPSLNMAD